MKLGNEKDDPLKRIQEEINEVARREKELREKMQLQKQQQTLLDQLSPDSGTPSTPISNTPPPQTIDTETLNINTTNTTTTTITNNNNNNSNSNSNSNGSTTKEILDETHSDDSGFSTSSSPVNGTPAIEKKYIRPNGYSIVPSPPPQKLLVRAMSTPQIFQPNRRFTFNPPQKGIMQRFIASRGKMIAAQQQQQQQQQQLQMAGNNKDSINGIANSSNLFRNGNGLGIGGVGGVGGVGFIPPVTITPPIIERDADGRPVRRGYIPVEEKIQKELRDLKNRETELKRIRKLHSRQSQPDLLDSIENDENLISDDESDNEHCFGPGKLRSSKSISELCDALNSNSISPRTTPSPNFDHKMHHQNYHHHHKQGGMRPAVSLAQLCDLDPEEAPSSHQLIAKWESLIQQNA